MDYNGEITEWLIDCTRDNHTSWVQPDSLSVQSVGPQSSGWQCACLPLEGRTLHSGCVCMDKQAPAGLASSGADVFSVQLPNIPSPPQPPSKNPDQAQSQKKNDPSTAAQPHFSSEVYHFWLTLATSVYIWPSASFLHKEKTTQTGNCKEQRLFLWLYHFSVSLSGLRVSCLGQFRTYKYNMT